MDTIFTANFDQLFEMMNAFTPVRPDQLRRRPLVDLSPRPEQIFSTKGSARIGGERRQVCVEGVRYTDYACPAGAGAAAVQYTASWSGVKEMSISEQDVAAVCEFEHSSTANEEEEDAPAMCDVEHTSAAEEEVKDACPVGMGDATVHKDGTACSDGPELVIPHELELKKSPFTCP